MTADLAARAGHHSVHYGDEVITFLLRLQTARQPGRVSIHVEADGRVSVDVPRGVTQAAVVAAVKQRLRWISRHVADAQARLQHVRPRDYTSGETVHYLGRRYRLRVTVDPAAAVACSLRGSFLDVSVRQGIAQEVRGAMTAWYRQRAQDVLQQRLASVAESLRWVKAPPPLRLQSMRVQWGSCSPRGRITLHPALVQSPRICIDYVVLHELCHLASHDHSPRFYKLLDSHMPGWRDVKARLDAMAEDLLRM